MDRLQLSKQKTNVLKEREIERRKKKERKKEKESEIVKDINTPYIHLQVQERNGEIGIQTKKGKKNEAGLMFA